MASKKRQEKSGAPVGNKNGMALKESEVRQHAYRDYCAHLSQGKGKKGWHYDKDGLRCTWETMEKYIKDGIEFDPLQKKIAESKGYTRWEGVVMDSAEGKNEKANTASLQMLMRNKYGWDKADKQEDSYESSALSGLELFFSQLNSQRSSLNKDSNSKMSD